MVAAAGAAVRAVDVERLRRQAGQPGLLVQGLQQLPLLVEACGGRHVDLDDAGVGGDRGRAQPGVRRRAVPLDHHRVVGLRRRRLDPGDQVEEVFERLGGRQEDVQQTVADLGDQGRRRGAVGVCDHRVAGLVGRQRVRDGQGIGLERRPRRLPADRVQRQPQARRRVAGQQHDAAAAQPPIRAGPAGAVIPAVQGQHESRWGVGGFVEARQQRGAGGRGVGAQVVVGVHRVAVGHPHALGQPVQRVLVGGPQLRERQPQTLGDSDQHLVRRLAVQRGGPGAPGVGEQRLVVPHRVPVGPPVERNLPARQRFSRIPLALSALDQPVGGPRRLEAVGQVGGALSLVRTVGGRRPLRRDLVVHRHERRLTAHGQPDVCRGQPLVDTAADLADRPPRLVAVGQGDPRVLVHAGDGVGELQHRFARLGAAADRRGAGRVRGGRQRDVPLAGEQPGRRVQADPAGAGDVHLGPRVQVGEVGGGPRRPVERLDVGGQLHQVARHEAGCQSHPAQDRHQQPCGIPARADAGAQRVIRGLHTGFHPHAVRDVGVDRAVEPDEHVDGAGALGHREVVHPRPGQLAGARTLAVLGPVVPLVHGPQVGLEVVGQRAGVGHAAGGPDLGPVLDEEVERVDHLEVGDEPDGDGQLPRGIRKHQAGKEIPHGVLLPVDEVLGRLDAQRIGLDGSAAVGRRAQSHHVRIHRDQPVKGVAGAVLQRHFDAHNR